MPSCTTCQRAQRNCDYADDTRDDVHDLRSRIDYLETMLTRQATRNVQDILSNVSRDTQNVFRSPLTGLETNDASFPSAWFLDVEFSRNMGVALPRPSMPASESILEEIGSPQMWNTIVDMHFETIHLWLPMVWRRRIDTLISNQSTRLPCGTALLLAGMKLATHVPDRELHPSQSRLYLLLKHELNLLENQGYISVGLLQAGILVAVYEMGHSIYPAAYLSIGRCVNVAHVMGLHKRKSAPQAISRPSFWSESEELTRVWCAILVLDR